VSSQGVAAASCRFMQSTASSRARTEGIQALGKARTAAPAAGKKRWNTSYRTT
jgi:hypothetical protein